jgi:hypothetical protein
MAEADLAIGAGGTTTWERMCLGLPSVVISTADNQLPACRALAEAGRIRYAGRSDEVDAGSLANLVRSLADSAEELRRLGTQNQPLVDGYGASRIAEALYPSEWARVRVRPPSGMEREDRLQFTFEAEGFPLGELRLTRAEDDALIDFDLDPITLGRGWEDQVVGIAADLARRCSAAIFGNSDRLPYLRSASARSGAAPSSAASYSIQVLSDTGSWMNETIPSLLADWLDAGHRVLWIHDRQDLRPGDFCFLLGCGQIVPRDARSRLRHCLVVHESDLPRGKGWSPLTWQILEGANRIPVSLIEAADKVDSGRIYAQRWLEFEGHELIDELRAAVARATLELCRRFVAEYPRSARDGCEQAGAETFYPLRTAKDSRIDTSATIDAQFNLLRVVDNARYPAYFERHSFRYELQVRKARTS